MYLGVAENLAYDFITLSTASRKSFSVATWDEGNKFQSARDISTIKKVFSMFVSRKPALNREATQVMVN